MTDPRQQREQASTADAVASGSALEAPANPSSCTVAFIALATVRDKATGIGPTTLNALIEAAGNSTREPQAWAAKAQRNFLSKPLPSDFLDFLLGLAVKHDMLDCIRELLKLGANAEAVDEIGLTPLLIATRAGNTAAISILIEAGAADVNSRGQTVWTALHFAALRGDPATIEALVVRGGDLSARTNKGHKSPLHIAAGHAQTLAVRELVFRWGADETQLDGRGRSASDIAGALTNVFDRGHRHAEEVERIQVMLANAPAERRWNRRRAVVMVVSRLRGNIARERSWSRSDREAEQSSESGGGGTSNAAKKRGGGGPEGPPVASAVSSAVVDLAAAAAAEALTVIDELVGSSQLERECDHAAAAAAAAAASGGEQHMQLFPPLCGMEEFRGAVVRLAREDDEGVFRSVVSFL
ncbi:unnamed protein product [Scytosiphon promiscuus]